MTIDSRHQRDPQSRRRGNEIALQNSARVIKFAAWRRPLFALLAPPFSNFLGSCDSLSPFSLFSLPFRSATFFHVRDDSVRSIFELEKKDDELSAFYYSFLIFCFLKSRNWQISRFLTRIEY